MSEEIIRTESITVDFSGFKALQNFSFSLNTNELRFLIGPNGAGKTTFLNVLTGLVSPISGKVFFKESTDLLKYTESEIARMGIARKLQTPSVFPTLTVKENLTLPLDSRKKMFSSVFSLSSEEKRKVDEVLDTMGLTELANQTAGALSHGHKQWLEIGMVIIQDPELVLLDEPVSGMTSEEANKTGELIEDIASERSVLTVEHDMEFVKRFASKVTVLHEGQHLAEGSFSEIQENSQVVEIYLGEQE